MKRLIFTGTAALITVCFIAYILIPKTTIFYSKLNFLSKECDYSKDNDCPRGQTCLFLQPKKSVCVNLGVSEAPLIIFPKPPESQTICTQGPKTATGRTHSYLNTGYAIDLASPKSSGNSAIRAVFEGTVWTHTGCDNNDESEFNNDPCGSGFGNWIVLISNRDNLIAFYSHLSSVQVNNGDSISRGQIIGAEGKSGQAGHRHLHFSIHKNIWNIDIDHFEKNGIWLPHQFRSKPLYLRT